MSSRSGLFRISFIMMLVMILIACSLSEELRASQTASKQTEIAVSWTETPTITVTATATKTSTLTPIPLPRPEIIDPSWELLLFDTFDRSSKIFPEREVDGGTISLTNSKSVWKYLSNGNFSGLGLNASSVGDLSDFFMSVEGNQIVCPGNCSYGL